MILDHVANLELSAEDEAAYTAEVSSLRYLAQRLNFLAKLVRDIELRIGQQAREERRVEALWFNGVPAGYEWVPIGLLASAFHWYAVSACNYVRLVGWMVNHGAAKKATVYLRSVLPAVHIWRNKVGAHFARTSPEADDTYADLVASVMFPITLEYGAFVAAGIKLAKGGTVQRSTANMRWGLTETHALLVGRYWPPAQ